MRRVPHDDERLSRILRKLGGSFWSQSESNAARDFRRPVLQHHGHGTRGGQGALHGRRPHPDFQIGGQLLLLSLQERLKMNEIQDTTRQKAIEYFSVLC